MINNLVEIMLLEFANRHIAATTNYHCCDICREVTSPTQILFEVTFLKATLFVCTICAKAYITEVVGE